MDLHNNEVGRAIGENNSGSSEDEKADIIYQDIYFEETQFTCFMAAYEDINSGDFYFRYSYQRMNHKVLIRDILYFESSKRKVFIVTREETFELYGKLNEIENSLRVCKLSFLRVHQSFLVNYKHIKGQSYDFVVMDNGKKISISEDRRKLISEQYCSMEDTYYVER